jgi:hypothetical protein
MERFKEREGTIERSGLNLGGSDMDGRPGASTKQKWNPKILLKLSL